MGTHEEVLIIEAGLTGITLAERLKNKLVNTFGYNKKIPILELKKTDDKNLKFFSRFYL